MTMSSDLRPVESGGLVGTRKKSPQQETQWVRAKRRGWYPPSIVEDVIRDFCDGNAAELLREMEKRTGKAISKQQVLGWRNRGQFPVEFVEVIQSWTRLPYSKLIARTRPRS